MGLFDKIGSTVITSYKADTSQQKRAVKDLKGEEKKRHEALLKQTEQQNAKLDSHVAAWGKVAAGVGVAVGAYKVLSDGFDTLQKNSRLAAATVGVDLKGLQRATNGLVDETRLLEFASKAMNGTFKLSQVEMEQALQGALALRKTLGVDLKEAMEATQVAITEGTTEPLKKLGLVIKGAENDTEEGLQAALAGLAEQAESLGGNLSVAGDEAATAGVSMADSMDKASEAMGRVAVALTPIISAFASVLETLVNIGEISDRIAGIDSAATTANKAERLRLFKQRNAAINAAAAQQAANAARSAEQDRLGISSIGVLRPGITGRDIRGFGPEVESPFPGVGPLADPSFAGGGAPRRRRGRGRGGRGRGGLAPLSEDELIIHEDEPPASIAEFWEGVNSNLAPAVEQLTEISEEGNILEQLFGTPVQIDAQTMAVEQMATAFDGFTSAFGEGVKALITGSESFASAFKNAVAESLLAMAVDMAMKAVQHTAMGIGAIAIGGPVASVSAGAHFKAAAGYAAGATLAGVAARGLGAGQSSGASAGGGAGAGAGPAGVGPSSGTGDAGGATTILILDDGFRSLSPRERISRVRETSRQAGIRIEGDVIIDE